MSARFKLVVAIAAVLAPTIWLYNPQNNFGTDWHNHAWMLAYYGKYIRYHFWPPAIFNTDGMIGSAQPVFYGVLFYPLLGIFSAVIPSHVVLRIAIVVMFALQFRSVRKAAETLGADEATALTLGCLVSWAVYPLTNIYNRNAITEFFGVALLTCAMAEWFILWSAREPRARLRSAHSLGLYLCLAIGTHPITAFYGILFMSVLVVVTALLQRQTAWRPVASALVWPVALTTVALLSWLYSTALWGGQVKVATMDTHLVYYPFIDSWLSRLRPFPIDVRMLANAAKDVSTPYLDTTINEALLVLLVATGARLRGRRSLTLIAVTLLLVAVLLVLSVERPVMELLPHIFRVMQFGYRMVSYINLVLLAGVLLLIGTRRERPSRFAHGALVICLLIGAGAMVVKLQHAGQMIGFYDEVIGTDMPQPVSNLPATLYGNYDYTIPALYRYRDLRRELMAEDIRFPVNEEQGFGQWQPVTFEMKAEGWVRTTVMGFYWNHVLLDGVEVRPERLRLSNVHIIYVLVPKGKHTLDLRITPDPTWVVLRAIGLITILGWLLAALAERVAGDRISVTASRFRSRAL